MRSEGADPAPSRARVDSRDMRRIHRTRRDWAADLGLFLFAACFAAVSSQSIPVPESLGAGWRAADQVVGGLGCAAVLLRRRRPVELAVALLLAGSVAHYLTGPAMVAVFTVAATRPWKATAWVAALVFAPLPVFLWQLPEMSEERAGPAVTYFALIAGSIGWGLFRRSRQQLIASLRERAELAEADAESRAERARMEAREEIAREMHDVLGHRLSLLSVHAGAGAGPPVPAAGLRLSLFPSSRFALPWAEVPALVAAHGPDLVLMDIRMPGVDGLAATERLRARPGAPEVLVLTTFHTDAHVLRALRAGAAGFLLKDTPPQEIVAAVRTVTAGDPVLSPAVTRRLIDRVTGDTGQDARRAAARARLALLAGRERDVALAVGRGLSNAEIGRELHLALPTVKTHVSRILTRLDLNNRVQIALLVHDANLPENGTA